MNSYRAILPNGITEDAADTNYLMQRLSTIKETNQSSEKESDFERMDPEFAALKQRLFNKRESETVSEEIREAVKRIAGQMDVHMNGILYLKELVWFFLLL